ncbi:hypothetical protein AAY473_016657 [Plecturocebus cupreus]
MSSPSQDSICLLTILRLEGHPFRGEKKNVRAFACGVNFNSVRRSDRPSRMFQTKLKLGIQMRFHHVGQARLQLLTLSDSPASALKSAEITDMRHHTRPLHSLNRNKRGRTGSTRRLLGLWTTKCICSWGTDGRRKRPVTLLCFLTSALLALLSVLGCT